MRSLLTLFALLFGSAAFAQDISPTELRPGLHPGAPPGGPPMMGGYREPPKINMTPSAPPPPEAPSSAGAALAALLCIGIVLLAVCYPMRRPE
jgi:hypothetical protein